jgi:hypothetical protein
MLTTAQLEQNKAKFQETNQKYNIMSKELEEFLGDDLFISPASSSLNMVGCYPGGLLYHMIKACKYSIKVNEVMPEPLKQPVERIVRAVFLSQIGKVFMFRMSDPTTHNGMIQGSKMYQFNDDIVRMRVGERSVYYAMKHGTQLTEEEYQAILNLDKDDEDKMAKYFSSSLTSIIKMGFEIAYMEEKNGKK